MDTLHSMKLFAEVVDSGSFSAAGRAGVPSDAPDEPNARIC